MFVARLIIFVTNAPNSIADMLNIAMLMAFTATDAVINLAKTILFAADKGPKVKKLEGGVAGASKPPTISTFPLRNRAAAWPPTAHRIKNSERIETTSVVPTFKITPTLLNVTSYSGILAPL